MTSGTFQATAADDFLPASTDRWTSNHRPAPRLSSGGMSGEGGAGNLL